MPTQPADRLEFASPQWIAAADELLNQAAAGEPGLDCVAFTMCESFTEAPPHLADPDGSVSWHAHFDGQRVNVGAGRISDADLTVTSDFQNVMPTARTQYGAGPDALGRAQREAEHRFGAPVYEMTGRPPEAPALWPVLSRLHDELAARTIDNPDLDHRLRRQRLGAYVDSLAADGYCTLERAMTDEFADELRDAMVDLVAERDGESPAMLLERGRIFEEVALHPWLTAISEAHCGPGFLLKRLGGQSRTAGPGRSPGERGDDLVGTPPPDQAVTLTAVWALDDVSAEVPKGSIEVWDGATWTSQGERVGPGERVTLHSTYSSPMSATLDDYSSIDPEILDRNPPDLTTMCGFDDAE